MITFTKHPSEEKINAASVEAPWAAQRAARTVAHQLLESTRNDFTLLPPGPRRGRMLIRFHTSADAHAAVEFFAARAEFSISPNDLPELDVRFVVTGGDIDLAQAVGSWTVTVPWMEAL